MAQVSVMADVSGALRKDTTFNYREWSEELAKFVADAFNEKVGRGRV